LVKNKEVEEDHQRNFVVMNGLSRGLSLLGSRLGSRQHGLLSTSAKLLAASGADPRTRVAVVLGAQWGDEGKGKLVDVLGARYDMVARFNGGSNAGHTLVVNGVKYAFHLLPCGMLYDKVVNVIGNGVVLHIPTLLKEIKNLEDKGIKVAGGTGKLKISNRAHLLFDFHQVVDGLSEASKGASGIGTTKKGIGPAYSSKSTRNGVRVGELLGDWTSFKQRYMELLSYWKKQFDNFEFNHEEELARLYGYRETMGEYVTDTVALVNHSHANGKRILIEGANACLLDIDFGTYPYVTSSNTTVGGVSTGLGLSPEKVESVVGVVKAYTTRVGGGPFPTELKDQIGEHMVNVGREFGTT
jgi:adenylosuccinate synthase